MNPRSYVLYVGLVVGRPRAGARPGRIVVDAAPDGGQLLAFALAVPNAVPLG